jgi:hypothetical protein
MPLFRDQPQPPVTRGGARGWVVLLALGAAVAVLIWVLAGADGTPSKPADDTETDKFTAISACKSSVESQLKAPATAEFGDEAASRSSTGTYVVTGHVDAENGFGAFIRTEWICDATPTADGYRGSAILIE